MTVRLAVLTSGGDAPGMNPALRGVVRRALDRDAEVFAVREGYEGLVNGWLDEADWRLVSGIQMRGGTLLGSSRSAAFRTMEGRARAIDQLVARGITALAVIGGDGSLTGAMALAAEWPRDQPPLRIAGIAGSIDNDLCGTDSTVGGDSALHRIVDAIDALRSTAGSHRRAFVVEVMGRRCGYLATAAAVCTGADVALVPEDPPADWVATVCDAVRTGRDHGQRQAIVLLAEGATDAEGHTLDAATVARAIEDGTGIETRLTVLGHVQRGGTPSAFDRITATELGSRAADVLIDGEDRPVLVGTAGHELVLADLRQAIDDTRAVHGHLESAAYDEVLALRSPQQQRLHHLWVPVPSTQVRRVLVAHVGAPAPGMNAALHGIARAGHDAGIEVVGAAGGLGPFVEQGTHVVLDPWALRDALGQGATVLGTDRSLPEADPLARVLDEHAIDGVIVVGGFEGLEALSRLDRPSVLMPATISDNVPGTDRSVGHDTALGAILDGLDRLRQSATGSGDRVFVVEVMGDRCGHLARRAALGAGAELVFTHEDPPDLARLTADAKRLADSFRAGRHLGLVVVADGVPAPFSAHTLAGLLAAESQGLFDTRVCVLGHLQQGGAPSPADRLLATELGVEALRHLARGEPGTVVVGRHGDALTIADLPDALRGADQVHRRRLRSAVAPVQPEAFRT